MGDVLTWATFDDGAASHPKVIRAGAEGVCLWWASILYANKHATNGRIDKDMVCVLYPPLAAKSDKLGAHLCKVGLWDDCGDHYEIHDYSEHQDRALKTNVEARRAADRERQRRKRERQIQQDDATERSRDGHDASRSESRGLSRDMSRASQLGHATLSVPYQTVPYREGEERAPEPEPPPGTDARSEDQIRGDLEHRFRTQFGKRMLAANQSAATWGQKNGQHCDTLSAWILATAEARGVTPDALTDELLDGFFADPEAKQKNFIVGWLAANPAQYVRRIEAVDPVSPSDAKRRTLRAERSVAVDRGDKPRIREIDRELLEINRAFAEESAPAIGAAT